MLLSKIKKHFFILLVRLKQKRELIKIFEEKNHILEKIIEAFLEVQSKKKSKEDLLLFKECEDYRWKLLQDKSLISYDIFGDNQKVSVKNICKKASSQPIWAQFLFLITKKTKSPNVLEIGTNLGVSGSYVLSALKNKKDSKFVTMEGLPGLCKIASKQFESIASTKYEILQGLYKNTFPEIINKNIKFNIFFIDGNHKKDFTLKSFKDLKLIMEKPTIMIFDDINWSYEMKDAWEIIKEDESVSYSIDFFKLGIVIIDSFKSKQNLHFKLHLVY